MNLRILKKQSKAAMSILVEHFGYTPDRFFIAERWENSHGVPMPCTCGRRRKLKHRLRMWRDCCSWCCGHPLKGTPMIGEMSGYETPEWDERTALEELAGQIEWADRPKTMSDEDYLAAQRLAKREPVDIDALMASCREEACA